MAKGKGTGSKTPKGQLPKNFDLLREKNLKNRSPEERKRISQMGVEQRKKNKEERMQLQKCMRAILEMKPNSKQKEELLKKFGFSDKDNNNKTLLMVALFQKALTGDVSAFKEINEMMEKLETYESTGRVLQNNVTINLVSNGESYKPNEQDEKDIWDAEHDIDWMEENDEWGNDIY